MKIKKALISIITCAGLLASTALPVFAGSPDFIEGKNESWNIVDGKAYWYEDGKKQGIESDVKCLKYDGTIRGREIYDKASDGWYWLDTVYDGAKATGKEVFMPYIYQNEAGWDDKTIRDNANNSDEGMKDYIYNCIKNKTGKWVRYDNDGKMLKGWVTIQGDLAKAYPTQEGNTYYYDTKTGVMAKGWVSILGVNYFFDEVTGKLLGAYSNTQVAKNDIYTGKTGSDRSSIFSNTNGAKYVPGFKNPGDVYAIEADVELSGTGSGYEALLEIGSGYDSIRFGLVYEKDSKDTKASGKVAVMAESVDVSESTIPRYDLGGIYYAADKASCHLMLVVDNTSGTAWLFHNYIYVGTVVNPALKGDALYIHARGIQLGGGSVDAAFKNVRVKSPVDGKEIITTKGNPSINAADVTGIDYTAFVANSANGYLHAGVKATNSTYTAPNTAYGYLEFVNGPKIF